MAENRWLALFSWKKSLLAVLGLAAIGFTILCWNSAFRKESHALRFSMGEELAFREDIVKILEEEASKENLQLQVVTGSRGEHAVERVAKKEVDVAIVYGGLGIENPNILQVVCLRGQPLHLFVKPELARLGLSCLNGKRINVGPADGETQVAVTKVLKHMGLVAGKDYFEEHHSYKEILDMKPEQLPDAVFGSASLPWPLGRTFVDRFGYQLLEVPFGPVLGLRSPVISETIIPAHTYGYNPAVPEKPIATLATNLIVICHKDIANKAIYRLLQVLCEGEFPRRIGKPPLDTATMLRVRDYPLHPGALDYLHRNDPLVNVQLIDQLKELRNFLVSGASALLLFWGWYRRRPVTEQLTEYLQEITNLEIDACRTYGRGQWSATDRQAFLDRLLAVRIVVLERNPNLVNDPALTGFLSRVNQVQETVLALPYTENAPQKQWVA